MNSADLKTTLVRKMQEVNNSGEGPSLDESYRSCWAKAFTHLEENKRLVIHGGRLVDLEGMKPV